MQKAQASVEYLIIIGFVAAITIPLVLIFNTHSTEVNDKIVANQADSIGAKIADAAESVYYLGEPSKVTFRIKMPELVSNITISGNEIVFYIRTLSGLNEIVKYCPVPINGSISPEAGIYEVKVESKGDYVWVSN
jgi:hypothetical protein